METQTKPISPQTLKRIGIAADRGGFELKEFLAEKLREGGFEVTDFGDRELKSDDDYPDFIIPPDPRGCRRDGGSRRGHLR